MYEKHSCIHMSQMMFLFFYVYCSMYCYQVRCFDVKEAVDILVLVDVG